MIKDRKLITAYDFGYLIKERRRALSLSQTALAKEIGVSRRWVSDIETGKETAELVRVIRALRFLGISLKATSNPETEAEIPPSFARLLAHRDRIGLPSK